VRQEDLDWIVYHQIPTETSIAVEDLAANTGLGGNAVAASLERLERALLVQRSGETVRLLSFQESLLRCQCRYARDLPFVIEDGVVKAKKRDG
jgi:hypothetical protein